MGIKNHKEVRIVVSISRYVIPTVREGARTRSMVVEFVVYPTALFRYLLHRNNLVWVLNHS